MDVLALRVAARFAAKRQMKPEKLRELMMKLRKGSGTSGQMSVIMPVFEALQGWTFDEILFPQPEVDYRPDNRAQFSSSRPGETQAVWEQYKKAEVDRLPTDSQLGASDLHKKVYMDVEPIQEASNGNIWFHYKAWQISSGVRVIAPNRATFDVGQHPDKFLKEYVGSVRSLKKEHFLKWLKNETPFYDQLNKFLGTDTIEFEMEQKERSRKQLRRTQGNATCPVCFGDFKLVPKTHKGKDKTMPGMVLHGYKRPGTGWIEGNCWGQDYPPFELSPEGTESWLKYLEQFEVRHREGLRRLQSGEVTELAVSDGKIVDGKYVPPTMVRKSEIDPQEWEKLFKKELRESEEALKNIEAACNQLRKAIAEWKPESLSL